MDAILSFVLLLAGVGDSPAASASVASAPPPAMAEACGDWLDLVRLLDEPDVASVVVDMAPHGDLVLVAVVHVAGGQGSSACAWSGLYAFPASIYAHSIVSVPFHADEME